MIRRPAPLLAALALAVLAPRSGAAAPSGAEEARAIAKEAYVYGVALEDAYRVMYAFSVDTKHKEYKGPFNSVLNVARVFTPADRAFVTPNSDTPYTFIGLDLRREPLVLTLPEIDPQRYFVFQWMDLYSFNFDYLGTRTTGNGGGSYLIAGPGWKGEAPPGVAKVLRAETELVNAVGRTQLFGPDDLENVKRIQAGYRLQPLSAFLGKPAPPAPPPIAWREPLSPPVQRTSLEFFDVLAFLLQFCPTHPSETALRERFARIGIEPGKRFDPGSLSPVLKSALADGMRDGQRSIDARRASRSGGRIMGLYGTREELKNDYVARALGAQVGIGATSPQEAVYPVYEHDRDGRKLDGNGNRYVLRFAPRTLPPVKAFWSVTLYDRARQHLVANRLNRYLISSPMLPELKRESDGGIKLYIQNESPGKELESNWLPAPKGPFVLALRLYWPEPQVLDGRWKPPFVERVKP